MDKKKKMLILSGIVGLLVCVVTCILIIRMTNKTPQQNNEVITDDGTIYNLPVGLFDSTANRDFNITLKSLKTKKYWEITERTIFTDITYQFTEPEIPKDIQIAPLAPGKMLCEVRYGENEQTDVFVFCTKNESKKKQHFKNNRLVYISYRGAADWELCGVNTGMTKEEVIEVLGNPTQAYASDVGHCMEWYVLKNGHAYIISVILNSDGNSVWKIILNIDNHPVFG